MASKGVIQNKKRYLLRRKMHEAGAGLGFLTQRFSRISVHENKRRSDKHRAPALLPEGLKHAPCGGSPGRHHFSYFRGRAGFWGAPLTAGPGPAGPGWGTHIFNKPHRHVDAADARATLLLALG